jgi:peptidoglycan-associated lipoprotein
MPRLIPFFTRTTATIAVLGVLLPSLLGAKGGCKRCGDRPDPVVDDAIDTQTVKLERTLQVSRVVPDVVAPGGAFSADVIGAGLKAGAKVKAGYADGTEVRVHTDARLSVSFPALDAGEYDVTVTNPDGESVTLRRALTVRTQSGIDATAACQRAVVYFDFDRDALTSEARGVLDPLVPCLQQVRGRVRLEGHTDERGTTEYNLALGQRRADSVHRYLIGQAVPVNKLRTVSYGKERPADPSSTERGWARNRRVEIVVED